MVKEHLDVKIANGYDKNAKEFTKLSEQVDSILGKSLKISIKE
ncbi:MAG: hypothetical protein U5L45_21830 [Saprospiraceae bacterium]|nr:hypothetical protein [Saprospiraceae bacterium]